MERWQEEMELLEEELRRLVDGFSMLSSLWGDICTSEYEGRKAFAAQKSSEYTEQVKKIVKHAKDLGLSDVCSLAP